MKDPIVEELHRIRRDMAQECNFDFGKLLEREREVFKQWKGKKVTKPFHPEWRAPHAAAVAEERAKYATGKK